MKYKYDATTMNGYVFDFIYGCALADAVLQRSFDGDRIWIGKRVEGAKTIVKTYIARVLSGDFKEESQASEEKHEKAFLQATIDLCKEINEKGEEFGYSGIFHFGNAQKLINMTVKHVYAHTYSIHTVEYDSIREKFRYCHCPMDQMMLEKVWNAYDGTVRQETLGYKNKYNGKTAQGFCKPWGNENFELDENGNRVLPKRYLHFQKGIRNYIAAQNGDIFPIEYDYIEWKPEIAKTVKEM